MLRVIAAITLNCMQSGCLLVVESDITGGDGVQTSTAAASATAFDDFIRARVAQCDAFIN